MKKTKWEILNNHLVLSCSDGTKITPSAKEVYEALNSSQATIQGVVCQNPSEELAGVVRFSQLGSPLYIELYTTDEGKIIFQLVAQRRGVSVPVFLTNGTIVDQCVSGNVWFYLNSNVEEIQEAIDDCHILQNGEISLRQYIKLVEQDVLRKLHAIDNKVDIGKLQNQDKSSSDVPASLRAKLYPYQETGYKWIRYMLEDSKGCLLGDEMGLGKTMQVIAEILALKDENKVPALVVAPVSLLANWQRECAKFAPSLKTYIHHGASRISFYKELLNFDVVIAPYTAIVSDIFMLNMVEWQLVALDEAQNIKSPYSARTKACKSLNRSRSLAITGTPFENHVTDIWSLLDFVQPKLLGSLQSYTENFSDDIIGGQMIEPILSPLMIRRLVVDVAKDLPEKVVSTQPLEMSDYESQYYVEFVQQLQQEYDVDTINMGAIQQLRVFCTHPFASVENNTNQDPAQFSVKYQRLCEILEEIVAAKEKVIVFCSFKRMFAIFSKDITNRFNIPVLEINGDTPIDNRQNIVDTFNEYNGPTMLVLNPKAAGAGLNITGANHVIHYTLEWNPALEDQASARAYRRGQQKTVFIYRLYYLNTVEQVVNERIERKRDISEVAIVGNDGISQDRADILRAIQLIPGQ